LLVRSLAFFARSFSQVTLRLLQRQGVGGLSPNFGKISFCSHGQFSFVMARAKRERVVQDEVEKANRRPTDRPDRHDTPHSFCEH